MNKNRRAVTNRTRKAMEKNIKQGQKEMIVKDLPRTDTLSPKLALKKYPPKRQKIEKPLMDAVVREMQIKKKKKTAKHSKRTTPGELAHRDSAPAHIHPEGGRWQKTIVKQAVGKRKALTTKLQKNKRK